MSRRFFGKNRILKKEPNTFIGGVASAINTAALLAVKLSVTESDIKYFGVSGDDIYCYIDTSYSILDNAFRNSLISYYIDLDGKVSSLGVVSFSNTYKLKIAYFPIAGIAVDAVFSFGAVRDLMCLQGASPIGGTVLNNEVFFVSTIRNLVVNLATETNNGGLPDGDLTADKVEIINLYYSVNTTVPNEVIDLSVIENYASGFEFGLTNPVSVNDVLGYLVFSKNNCLGFMRHDNLYISGMPINTTYTDVKVITVDVMGNVSGYSNSITATTASTYNIPTSDIVSYWNFDNNYEDQVGINDGIVTSMSLVASGGIGNVADFTASTNSKVEIVDSDSLSFGNGITDSPFSGVVRVKFSSTGDQWILNKRNTSVSGLDREYQLIYYLGGIWIQFYDQSTSGQLITKFTTTISTGVWYEIGWSYDGINQPKLFVNGVNVGAAANTGIYVAMENLGAPLTIGKDAWNNILSLNGYEDELAIFNTALTSGHISDIYAKHEAGLALTE